MNYKILGGEYAHILVGGQAGTLAMASSASGPARLGFVIPASDRVWMENAVISQSVHLNDTTTKASAYPPCSLRGLRPIS